LEKATTGKIIEVSLTGKILQMKKRFILYILVSLMLNAVGQNASWNAVLPAQFPTNSSGQINGISRVSQMKFSPTDSNKMYAMSARGGLFITGDGGHNWSVAPGTDFMPYARLASVCIDYTNDSIIYIGTGDHDYYYGGSGVWKSVDGGQTFNQTSFNSAMVLEIIMDPANHNNLVAATNKGIYKSYDAGGIWTAKTATNIQFDDMKKVESPLSATLFAATTDSTLYRSADFGETWTQLTNGIQLPAGITSGDGCRIALTPADTNVVYLGMVANGGTIYKSVDWGNTFSAVKSTPAPYLTYYDDTSTSGTQGDYNFAIGADRSNPQILYLVAQNVWRSLDGGVTWTELTHWWANVHTDMHQVTVSPYNLSQVWNMNDGGVWLSTDTGDNWTPMSNGIAGEEIYHGNCSPTRRDMISIGTQDNGELYADSVGWYTNRGGDWGPECAFDFRPFSDEVYYFDQVTRRTVNGGDNTFGLNVTGIEDMAFNRANPNLAFVADSAIYRTTDLLADTPTWTLIYSLNKPIQAIHSDLTDTNKLYIITSDNTFYVSNNAMAASPTFNAVTLPGAANNAASITSIKGKPGVVYITGNTKAYRSADTGTTWTNISFNLPSVNQVRILGDEFYPDSETVFVASNDAVYYKTVNQSQWTLFSNALPSRPTISDMSIYNDTTANAILRVAVYGRGMWQVPIAGLRPLQAIMTASTQTACRGVPITFSDVSNGTETSRLWSFPGGTPSTSIAVNPVVTYNAFGAYNATLTVYNGSDSSSVTKTYYIIVDAGMQLNIAEGFESDTFPRTQWTLVDVNSDGYSWQWDSTAGAYGTSLACMFFDNFYEDAGGKVNDILTPKYDFTGYDSIWLTFDHAYRVYTDSTEIDSFAILISNDCGATFNTIYYKGGAQFATVPTLGGYTSPAPGDWQTDTVNLSAYTGETVILDFRNIGHYGNDIFIDNIDISAHVLSNTGTDTTICSGTTANIGVAPVNGVSYSWSPATGLSNFTISNPVASPDSNITYILTATQDSSHLFSIDTIQINVTTSVTPAVAISSNPAQNICLGSNVTFLANISYGGPSPSFLWLVNGLNVGIDSVNYSSSTLQNGDTVYCILTSNAVCAAPNIATSNIIIVQVDSLIQPAISIAVNPGMTICDSQTIAFTGTPVNGGLTPGYWWLVNGNLAGTSSTFNTSNLQNGDVVICYMASSALCASPDTVNSIADTITVNPIPATPLVTTNSPLCENGTLTLSAPLVANAAYVWTGPSGFSSTAQDTSINNSSAINEGNYVLVVIVNGCTSLPDTADVIVNSTPLAPTISHNGNILTSSAVSGNQWMQAGTQINGAQAQSYTVTVSGWYSVLVTDSNGCSSISDSIYVTVSDIDALAQNDIKIIPNPFAAQFRINYNSTAASQGDLNIRITDALGRLVFESRDIHASTIIDLSAEANGIYLLQILGADSHLTYKLVKEE
jgi:photosystem II stability/assembly factor-like uncharacterized protein